MRFAEIGTGSSNTNEELKMVASFFCLFSRSIIERTSMRMSDAVAQLLLPSDGVGVGKISLNIEGSVLCIKEHTGSFGDIDNRVISGKYYFYYMNASMLYIEKKFLFSFVRYFG